MTKKTKKAIEDTLSHFVFVKWDRYVFDKTNNIYYIYGWIDRKKDKYKDFIQVSYEVKGQYWDFLTSSVEKHDTIIKMFGIKEKNTINCIRVEDSFDVVNSIKLKSKTKKRLNNGKR